MATVVKMPRMSDTMSEGVLVRWLKKEGDTIEPGEVIAEVETDKATMEFEAFDSGILKKILLPEGKAIPVGGAIAILVDEPDEDISNVLNPAAAAPAKPAVAAPAPAAAPAAAPVAAVSAAPMASPASSGRIKASPLARKMAGDLNINLGDVKGSGPGGRIIRRDIDQVTAHATEPLAAPVVPVADAVTAVVMDADSERQPLSQMRKTIARRLTEAKQTVPHFYLTAEIDMGPALKLREQLNQAGGGSVKISVNDLILKACATALEKHPRVNASFDGDHLILHKRVHMGVAVAVEDGLMTPTVKDCHTLSIGRIAQESRSLAERAMARKLKPEEYTGATFTVSNLGMFGIVEFVAIINPPQAAILAVGAVREIPVVENGQLVVGKRMRVTLSCDHRVIDGAVGAQFLVTLRETLENPMRLVL